MKLSMNLLLWMVLTLSCGMLASPVVADLSDKEKADGFVSLFGGTDLSGWEGDPNIWRAESGAIVGETADEGPCKIAYNTFLVWKGGDVDDFVLRLDIKLSKSGNSGIQYRSWMIPGNEPHRVAGYQADFDGAHTYSGILHGEGFSGILCSQGQESEIGDNHQPKTLGVFADDARLKAEIKVEDWNSYEVTARGFTFTNKINGNVMSICTDSDKEQRKASGLLAIQAHVGPAMKVEVRNIRIKKLAKTDKHIALVAGPDSHGFGLHAHYAGLKLLAEKLNSYVPGIFATAYRGFPYTPSLLQDADAVVVFTDGGAGNLMLQHRDAFRAMIDRGVGVGLIHYTLEVPQGDDGALWQRAVGGYFEQNWSVNPFYAAEFKSFPTHPAARGLKPQTLADEWYYNMRFVDGMKGVTPILTCIPPDGTREQPDGTHSNNPEVRKNRGRAEHLCWVYERDDSHQGRGFGFTGGHLHWNWANPVFLKTVLNGIVWAAKGEVPPNGIDVPLPTFDDLLIDHENPPNLSPEDIQRIKKQISDWQQ